MTPKEYYHHDTGYPVGDVVKAWKKSYNLSTAITYLARAGLKTPDQEEDCLKAIHHILMELTDCTTANWAMLGLRARIEDYHERQADR